MEFRDVLEIPSGRQPSLKQPETKHEYDHAHGDTAVHARDRKTKTNKQSHIHTDGHASLTHCPETDFVYKPQQLMYRPKTSGILF